MGSAAATPMAIERLNPVGVWHSFPVLDVYVWDVGEVKPTGWICFEEVVFTCANARYYSIKKAFLLNEERQVRTRRFELPHPKAPPPQSGVSTSFTTCALERSAKVERKCRSCKW